MAIEKNFRRILDMHEALREPHQTRPEDHDPGMHPGQGFGSKKGTAPNVAAAAFDGASAEYDLIKVSELPRAQAA